MPTDSTALAPASAARCLPTPVASSARGIQRGQCIVFNRQRAPPASWQLQGLGVGNLLACCAPPPPPPAPPHPSSPHPHQRRQVPQAQQCWRLAAGTLSYAASTQPFAKYVPCSVSGGSKNRERGSEVQRTGGCTHAAAAPEVLAFTLAQHRPCSSVSGAPHLLLGRWKQTGDVPPRCHIHPPATHLVLGPVQLNLGGLALAGGSCTHNDSNPISGGQESGAAVLLLPLLPAWQAQFPLEMKPPRLQERAPAGSLVALRLLPAALPCPALPCPALPCPPPHLHK